MADAVIDASRDDPVEAINALTGGYGAPYVLECSGAPEASGAAVKSTKFWGAIAMVGMGPEVTST